MIKHNYKYILSLLCLLLLGFLYQHKITIYTIGDSTMCLYDTANTKHQRGWAQMLPKFFNKKVDIVDAARRGRSSKSFFNEGLWGKVIDKVKPGDYVFIQFGHNDEKKDTARGTKPWKGYYNYLKLYIEQTREKGGIPILFTPIVRRHFDTTGHLNGVSRHNLGPGDSLGNYPKVMHYLADEMKVPLIDLTEMTKKLVESYGPEKSKELYISIDKTHLNIFGATQVAALAVEGLKENDISISEYLNNYLSKVMNNKQ